MFRIEKAECQKSNTPCSCCGSFSEMFSGYLHREGSGTIYYRFNWTIGKIAV